MKLPEKYIKNFHVSTIILRLFLVDIFYFFRQFDICKISTFPNVWVDKKWAIYLFNSGVFFLLYKTNR
jgi:hypothetical protein